MINFKYLDKKLIITIAGFIILLIAIPVTIYLVSHQQILKSKAVQSPVIDAFEFKDSSGNVLNCDGSTNPPTCTTQTNNIVIKVKDLNPLLNL